MGLSEAHQVLMLNRLRHRVKLRTDRRHQDRPRRGDRGHAGRGRSSASAPRAWWRWDCIMVRQCHSNTCPVGVCTQDESLRAKFEGTPEKVINLFSLRCRGRTHHLGLAGRAQADRCDRAHRHARTGQAGVRNSSTTSTSIRCWCRPIRGRNARYCTLTGRNEVPETLDGQMIEDAAALFTPRREDAAAVQRAEHRSRDRHQDQQQDHPQIRDERAAAGASDGAAGAARRAQSLGAFAVQGLKLEVFGDSNDYVGKGLSGATIVVRPGPSSTLQSHQNTIIGNTCLYGATGGLSVRGGAGGGAFRGAPIPARWRVVEGCGLQRLRVHDRAAPWWCWARREIISAPDLPAGWRSCSTPRGAFRSGVNADTLTWQRVETEHWEEVLELPGS